MVILTCFVADSQSVNVNVEKNIKQETMNGQRQAPPQPNHMNMPNMVSHTAVFDFICDAFVTSFPSFTRININNKLARKQLQTRFSRRSLRLIWYVKAKFHDCSHSFVWSLWSQKLFLSTQGILARITSSQIYIS